MKIVILAIGDKTPSWVEAGFEEYAQRMPVDASLQLKQIRAVNRSKNQSTIKVIAEEEKRLLAAMPSAAHRVVLDVKGKQWNTLELVEQFKYWGELGKPIVLIIGGADGLSSDMVNQSAQRWSLSHLTLPHYLVRVIVAEQIYRTWSIISNHPYHRG